MKGLREDRVGQMASVAPRFNLRENNLVQFRFVVFQALGDSATRARCLEIAIASSISMYSG